MSIESLYISKIEPVFDAVYIADVFEYLGIAQISRVAIESLGENSDFNCAYVDIKYWYDTEVAYNFINRLNNTNKETRLIHHDEDWWVVEINTALYKTARAYSGIELTIFREPMNYYYNEYYGSIDNSYEIQDDYAIDIAEETEETEEYQVPPSTPEFSYKLDQVCPYAPSKFALEDKEDFEKYIAEIDEARKYELNSCAYALEFV